MVNDFRISKNFNLSEFSCKCCGSVKIDSEVVKKLQLMRDKIQKPIIITSGYRCPKHNQEVGGTDNSYHTQGLAVDIVVDGYSLDELEMIAKEVGFRGIGIYRSANFIHLDLGPVRRWEV
jgi:uncharacterized protein YcbK (DUF882 family)